MQVLAHGGAGSSPEDPDVRQSALEDAVGAGERAEGPLSAVLETVRALEANPRFNAGTGSSVQSDGSIRTDAGLMIGDGTAGAAASMPDVEHAVDVARVVAEETPHVLVSGQQAVDLAATFGIETDADLWSERTRQRWDEQPAPEGDLRSQLEWVRERFGGADTVGAVAADGAELAAATSTGGRWAALAGRVGDVPQVGAGFYASERAAASATGAGEAIARYGLARQAVDAVANGDDPQTAADRVIRGFETETGETAGIILIDADERVGSAYNSELMQTAAGDD